MQDPDENDPHISVSFSLPRSVKDRMDRRIDRLLISRTDYLKLMVLWELDKGEEAPFDFPRKPGPPAPVGETKKKKR